MSSYGAWSVKGIDDRARAAAKAQARRKGVTLGDYINDLLLQSGQDSEPTQNSATLSDEMSAQVQTNHPHAHTPPPYAEPAAMLNEVRPTPSAPNPIDSLTRRIEAAEARSTLAITGIDQSVIGLLARIESTENNSSAMAAEVEGMIDELCETHESLQAKVRELEADDTAEKNLQTMKNLEQALATLASHVHDENALIQDESAAVKGRIESGFDEVTERVENIEGRIETRLSEATERVQKAVEQAELRAEGTSRHLSERFTAVESTVATRLARVDDIASRMGRFESSFFGRVEALEGRLETTHQTQDQVTTRLTKIEQDVTGAVEKIEQNIVDNQRDDQQFENRISQIEEEVIGAVDALEKGLETGQHSADEIATRVGVIEDDVSGAISTMEETLLRIQERLNRAEATTDNALKALEETFENLDQRIESAASATDPAQAEELRKIFEQKFEDLASDLRTNVESSRQQMAEEIEKAAQRINPELAASLEGRVEALQTQIVEGHDRTAEAMQAMGEQVNHLAIGLNHRLEDLEERNDEFLVEQVTDKLNEVTYTFENRIAESEQRSAAAIEQVGQQVATAIQRVKVRQGTQQTELLEAINQTKNAQEARLSQALSNISDRLEKMQSSTAASVSPVQKAIVSLASRLEAVEDFTTPPHAQRPSSDLPRMPALNSDSERLERAFETGTADFELKTAEPETVEAEPEHDFYADAPDYEQTDLELEDTVSEATETYQAEVDEEDEDETDIHNFLVSSTEESDPFSEFEEWEEDGVEAQDETEMESETEEYVEEEPVEEFEPVVENTITNSHANDYLNRARRAAMAAANESEANTGRGRKLTSGAMPKLNLGASTAKENSKKKASGRLPILAAASVLTISAAGAGGYVYLRGKQNIDPPPTITKAEFLGEISTPALAAAIPEIVATVPEELSGAEGAIPELDTDLFAETVEPEATPQVMSMTRPVDTTPTIEKPRLALIPDMLSLKQSAMNGNPVAEYQYAEEQLADQNYALGVQFVSSAAEAGLPIAQYRLAKLHERGLGVPQDLDAARSWTERAAQGGNVKAMHDLAVFYADGEGGVQSYNGAVEWFRKAAAHGLVDSQYNLGVMYENGLGVSANPADALYWFLIAEANGDSSASENVSLLKSALPTQMTAEIELRVADWSVAKAPSAANGDFGRQPWEENSTDQIRSVQAALNAFGYAAGTADGIIGPGTRQALRRFQLAEGLDVDGRIDTALIEALNAQIAASS